MTRRQFPFVLKTTIPTQKLKDMNVFVAFKRYISIQISIVTRDNAADALDFYVENARSITYKYYVLHN